MSSIMKGLVTEKKKKPKPTSPEKWSRAKAKARSKFDVYPSAYANAYAAKEYKKMGGGWRMGESQEDVREGHADQQRTIVKRNGQPVGEIGIDRESSPGVGQYYMKHYASGTDLSGYSSREEALGDLRHIMKQSVYGELREQGVAEGSLEEYGDTPKGQKMLAKVHHRAADRVTSKKADKDPQYARKAQQTQDRAWDRLEVKEEGVSEDNDTIYKNWRKDLGKDYDTTLKLVDKDYNPNKPRNVADELAKMNKKLKSVAEGSGKNVVKSVKVGNFRHDLVDTGMGWQVRIYNGDELYDTGMSKNSEQKGLAALEDAVAYTEKQTRTKRQGVAEATGNPGMPHDFTAVQPGAEVWYKGRFAGWTTGKVYDDPYGKSGKMVAFEPNPSEFPGDEGRILSLPYDEVSLRKSTSIGKLKGPGQGMAEGSGNWYVRVKGKVLKDKKFNAIPFSSKETATQQAFEIHRKKQIPLEMIKLTQSWMDSPEQGVAEGIMDTIKGAAKEFTRDSLQKKIKQAWENTFWPKHIEPALNRIQIDGQPFRRMVLGEPRVIENDRSRNAILKQYTVDIVFPIDPEQWSGDEIRYLEGQLRDIEDGEWNPKVHGLGLVSFDQPMKSFQYAKGRVPDLVIPVRITSLDINRALVGEQGVAEGYQDDSKEREENLRYSRSRNPVADTIRKKLNPNQKEQNKEKGVAENWPDYDDNQYSLTDSTGKELTLLRGNTPEEAIERAKQLIGSNEKLLATFGLVKLTPKPYYIVRGGKKQGVAEAGPFSYGKAPRKGSVADLAAKKRREQEQGKQPVEPRDQQVGVAKVTKGVQESGREHGSAYDRGSADSWYGRPYNPQRYSNPQDQAEYEAGYSENESQASMRKDYGDDTEIDNDDEFYEDTTMRFSAEKLPRQNPYGGLKDRQFRGAIAETEAVNRNDGDGWRWYEPREEEQLDELKCWPGYTRVKGVPAGAVGSCKKKTKESSIMKGLQK